LQKTNNLLEPAEISDIKIQKEGTKILFKSKFLEILTRTSPWIIIPLDLAMIAGILFWGVAKMDVSLKTHWWMFLVGFFSWTLLEYVMHRFAFHFPAKSDGAKKATYALHLIHHHFPNDQDRLFQPPAINVGLAVFFLGLFYLILGKLAFIFIPGLIAGYITYSSIHYSIHRFKPPFKFLQVIWRHHTLHHYRFPNKAFGVSSPFWDYIFGTMPPQDLKKS
jgi:sterol desaturase/sphingolipid hydroxylase (fatty acid hydroxylase superfamily)